MFVVMLTANYENCGMATAWIIGIVSLLRIKDDGWV